MKQKENLNYCVTSSNPPNLNMKLSVDNDLKNISYIEYNMNSIIQPILNWFLMYFLLYYNGAKAYKIKNIKKTPLKISA